MASSGCWSLAIFRLSRADQGGEETGLAAALQGLASPDKGLPWLDVTPVIHQQPLTRQGLETCTWPGR